jgi:hypothetical protein
VTHTNKSYPINHMRNLALNAVTTTHVLLSDADMLPSVGLCKRATAALSEVADEERKHGTEVAVVVPAFDVSDYYEARIRVSSARLDGRSGPNASGDLGHHN